MNSLAIQGTSNTCSNYLIYRIAGRVIGGDVHYLMEVPSPKFSSALDDDIGEDEEKNEVIRCILYNDH